MFIRHPPNLKLTFKEIYLKLKTIAQILIHFKHTRILLLRLKKPFPLKRKNFYYIKTAKFSLYGLNSVLQNYPTETPDRTGTGFERYRAGLDPV